jgi:MFS family permease
MQSVQLKQPDHIHSQEQNTIWSKPFVLLLFVSFFSQLNFYMHIPILPSQVGFFGGNNFLVGMTTFIYGIAAMICRPYAGYAADTYNRKNVLLFSVLLEAVVSVGYVFSNSIFLTLALRIPSGIGLAFTTTTLMSTVADVLPLKRMGEGMGIFGLAQVFSMVIAPGIGFFLIGQVGYKPALSICAVAMIIALVFIVLLEDIDKTKQIVKNKVKFKLNRNSLFAVEAIVPAIITACNVAVYNIISSFIGLHAGASNLTSTIGLFFTVYGITLFITRPLFGRISDQRSATLFFIPGSISIIIALILISQGTTMAFFLVAGFLFSIGHGSLQPVLQSVCVKLVTPERRGIASTTYYLGMDVGGTLGPLLGGVIAMMTSYQNLFLIVTFIPIFALIVGATNNRQLKEKGI